MEFRPGAPSKGKWQVLERRTLGKVDQVGGASAIGGAKSTGRNSSSGQAKEGTSQVTLQPVWARQQEHLA